MTQGLERGRRIGVDSKAVRKLAFIILSVSLSVAAVWDYRIRQELDARSRFEKQEEARLSKLESELDRAKRMSQAGVLAQQQVVENLRQQYAAEKANFDVLQQRFDIARNRGLPGSDYTADLENRIHTEKDAIQELDAEIKNVKAQEADLGKQGRIEQDQQRLGYRQSRYDLEAQIHQQEQLVRDTGAEIKLRKSQGLVDPDARDQLQQLQGQLKDQKVQLQNLKDMRPQLSAQGAAAVNSVEGQVQDQHTQLRLSREQLEARSRQEKATLADLQKQLDSAKNDRNGQKLAYDRLQADYTAERDKIGALKSQLTQEEQRLQALTP